MECNQTQRQALQGVQDDASHTALLVSAAKCSAPDWKTRVIHGNAIGSDVPLPAWLDGSYATLCSQVLHPAYPCFFGTVAERRGEMFYAFVNGKDTRDMAASMLTFSKLASMPAYRKHNIAVFFEPDLVPLTHAAYHDLFWSILQHLHDVDPVPEADQYPDPSEETWEFSFAGLEMFVVCACPSFATRHSRNLGPGMVLLFQPRAVFVDTITNKVIGRDARNQVRRRLQAWDDVAPHPDLGFYGDPGNLEWKQYFLGDDNQAAVDRCPFLSRKAKRASASDTRDAADAAPQGTPAAVSVSASVEVIPPDCTSSETQTNYAAVKRVTDLWWHS